MTALYHNIFGTNPCQKYSSLLEPGDHPEIDDSEILDARQTQQDQSLIGALQWAITISQFDIHTAVMTLSSFHAMPRCGHMEHVKRIYGYLARMSEGVIRVRQVNLTTLLFPIRSMIGNEQSMVMCLKF